MKNILVTGGNVQLANCIKDIEKNLVDFDFIHTVYDKLDITQEKEIWAFFEKQKIDYFVNCAAYTVVDKAESAESINETGVICIAKSIEKYNSVLIRISKDLVFDGAKTTLFKENYVPNLLGIYGLTKFNGEKASTIITKRFVIRTSWLYPEHFSNFLKIMLRLGNKKDKLNVVCDQVGTPMYAEDLVKILLKTLKVNYASYGIYNYGNRGIRSWNDFAKVIFDQRKTNIKISSVRTEEYSTTVRPNFSEMYKSKLIEALNI